MESQEALKAVANLRLRFQMNRRLRLESLAALSKVFREYGEPLSDELLASVVLALPVELLGQASSPHNGSPQYASDGETPSVPLPLPVPEIPLPPPLIPLPPPTVPIPQPLVPVPPGDKEPDRYSRTK